MAKLRVNIPFDLQARIFYACAWTCCVCRQRRVSHLHHIDGDPSNNSDDNIVGVCSVCHDEAHTERKLSQNLTPKKILDAKRRWEEEVRRRAIRPIVEHNVAPSAMWTYFNHSRLYEFVEKTGCRFDKNLLSELQQLGLVDSLGVPQRVDQPSDADPLWTVYHWLPTTGAHKVRALNSQAVDCIACNANPIMLDAIWQRKLIRTLVNPGRVCFCLRNFYFRTVLRNKSERLEERIACSRARKISLKLRLSTRDMFGSSSVHDSFRGHRSAAVLCLAKNITDEGDELVISATPIALGVGFMLANVSPYASANVPTLAEGPRWRLTSEWLAYASSK